LEQIVRKLSSVGRRQMRCVAYFLVALLLSTPDASAMGCGPAETISKAVQSGHTSVFKASVLHVLPGLGPAQFELPIHSSGYRLAVRFSTIRIYKGAPPQIVTVYFNPDYDLRPLAFHEGDVFLLSTYPFSIDRPGFPREYFFGANVCSLRKLVRMAK
jgi:hypothetical protein